MAGIVWWQKNHLHILLHPVNIKQMCRTVVNKQKNFLFVFNAHLAIECSEKLGKEGTGHPHLLVHFVHDWDKCGMCKTARFPELAKNGQFELFACVCLQQSKTATFSLLFLPPWHISPFMLRLFSGYMLTKMSAVSALKTSCGRYCDISAGKVVDNHPETTYASALFHFARHGFVRQSVS